MSFVQIYAVEVDNPLKQGLKLHFPASRFQLFHVEVDNPLKQGLKPGALLSAKWGMDDIRVKLTSIDG